ncbi:hypothetical protein Slala03_55720 [Streptomyces lavendulae subsp. lavendulae]|uniref:hypothetical protein n=1 Tax=Streptomyces lavendulae TaxID=1914 RepID=UPI0024A08A36|nr:hypothetical protein [Streptomyces lavendulae]GLV85883.1 hypothetical protein Slala03_55720 [Streptomyces lavendulae subsp. lavendulae]
MTVITKFLDRQLVADARYGGRMHLDACPPLSAVLDRYLRSCARNPVDSLRVNREIRTRCAQRPGFGRLLAHVYAGEPGYRAAWRPNLSEVRTPAGPDVRPLLERWDAQAKLAIRAAEEVGLDFSWREVNRQDGQGLVMDGTGRPLWETAVYPEDGYTVSRYGPGRVLRELAVRRELLNRLDVSAEADRALLRCLIRPQQDG